MTLKDGVAPSNKKLTRWSQSDSLRLEPVKGVYGLSESQQTGGRKLQKPFAAASGLSSLDQSEIRNTGILGYYRYESLIPSDQTPKEESDLRVRPTGAQLDRLICGQTILKPRRAALRGHFERGRRSRQACLQPCRSLAESVRHAGTVTDSWPPHGRHRLPPSLTGGGSSVGRARALP
jgi:hypothetical protein